MMMIERLNKATSIVDELRSAGMQVAARRLLEEKSFRMYPPHLTFVSASGGLVFSWYVYPMTLSLSVTGDTIRMKRSSNHLYDYTDFSASLGQIDSAIRDIAFESDHDYTVEELEALSGYPLVGLGSEYLEQHGLRFDAGVDVIEPLYDTEYDVQIVFTVTNFPPDGRWEEWFTHYENFPKHMIAAGVDTEWVQIRRHFGG